MEPSADTSYHIVDEVYDIIRREFVTGDREMNRVLDRIFSVRGKGIRPVFMELVARKNGGSWESVRRAAGIVEAVHIASLLHDDVVDGAGMRRGIASLNTRYSDKVSVLFGDYVFIRALMLSHSLGHPDVAHILRRAVERMIEGEISDSLHPVPFDENAYLSMIGDKTASLFAAAGEIAVALTGGGEAERVQAGELGEAVGIAFQIIDDVLDCLGDEGLMGKPARMDLRGGCPTLPLIHALRECGTADAVRLLLEEGDMRRLLDEVQAGGGLEYARERARGFIEKARRCLGGIGGAGMEGEFERLFSSIIDRER